MHNEGRQQDEEQLKWSFLLLQKWQERQKETNKQTKEGRKEQGSKEEVLRPLTVTHSLPAVVNFSCKLVSCRW